MNSNDLISIFETHCKGNFPREFGAKTGKKGFTRNLIANSAEGIYNLAEVLSSEIVMFRHTLSQIRTLQLKKPHQPGLTLCFWIWTVRISGGQ